MKKALTENDEAEYNLFIYNFFFSYTRGFCQGL